MPFKSEKQRKWMHANKPKMAKKWEKEEKSVEEDRDYKAEYKKYGSSTKAKKYRAELNKYNRQKGTYGNGDGKDASHKGGKIVGFEAESKNRGRAEKSRLKKESVNEGKVEPKVKSRLNVLAKRLTDLKRADTQLEKSMWEAVMEYTKIYNMVKDGKYFETAGFKQLPGSLELNHKRFSQKFSKSLDSIIKSTKDSVKRLQLKESVNEATSLGADMLLGGLAQVVRKAGMKPKTAKMMGGGFKVSKRDKVGFKMDVEIRGFNKKKTFKLQFEMERGMLYVIIKNKPVKLGKYTMVNPTAQNLKKLGSALIGETVNEADDHELEMAHGQLERSIEYSQMILKKLQDGGYDELPGWVQGKLTKSMDYLQSVFNYYDGKDGLDEAIPMKAFSSPEAKKHIDLSLIHI